MSKEVQVISGRMKQLCGDEQKKKLVLESYESGLSLNQFAKERGISPASLCQWRKKYPTPFAGFNKPQDEDEIQILRSENDTLKKELVKIKAYLGHKLYELDSHQIN